MLRAAKDNASFGKMEPEGYYGYLREVIDIIECHTPSRVPASVRRLLAHWYRSKVLWRLTGAVFLRRDPDFNRVIFEECRSAALERFPREIDPFLPFALRVRSHLLRMGDLEGIYSFARFEAKLRARVKLVGRSATSVRIESQLRGLSFLRVGERIHWHPPDELRGRLDGIDLDFTESVARGHITPLVRSVADKTEIVLQHTQEVILRDRGDRAVTPVVIAEVSLPTLAQGEWQLVIPLRVSGLNHTAMTVRQGERTAPLNFVVDAKGRLRRPPWIKRQLSNRLPRRLVRAIRAAR